MKHTLSIRLTTLLLLAATLLSAGCSKNDPDMPNADTPATEILAKAVGKPSIDTRASITGTSLHGKTADVFAMTTKLADATNNNTVFSDAYARGTMTFDDAKYVGFDKGTLVGNALLPQNPVVPVYLYALYPAGWEIAPFTPDGNYQALKRSYDGSTDLMASFDGIRPEVEISYGTANDKGELNFYHILARYNIRVKADSPDAQTAWGRVKSVAFKNAATMFNTVEVTQDNGNYFHDPTKDDVAFFKLEGTTAAPVYTDHKYGAADFASSQELTDAFVNTCYSIVQSVNVDNDKTTPEIVLEVVTMTSAGGKEHKTEVPISLDKNKFLPHGQTSGYSIIITLNFRAGVIQAIASVEEWKDGGMQEENVDKIEPVPIKIGQFRDGGIVYQINGENYKVMSLDAGDAQWSALDTYVLGAGDGQDKTDGKKNVAAMKAYSAAHTADSDLKTKTTGVFATDFPAAAYCDAKNTGEVSGWYLPAANEMLEIFTAYSANKTLIDNGLTNNGGTNKELDGYWHWSATECDTNTSKPWFVSNSGINISQEKHNELYLRCIKVK